MKSNSLFILLSLCLTFGACSKNEELRLINGHYSGSYYYRGPNWPAVEKRATDVTLVLDQGNTYSSSAHPDQTPAGGSGNFVVLKNNIVEFEDKNSWTANFDWGLILDGSFVYEIKGDSLILTRSKPCQDCYMLPPLYQYRLKRIN